MALLVPGDGAWRVAASAARRGAALEVVAGDPAVAAVGVPASLLQHVAAQRETVCIDAALAAHAFSSDPYFETHHPRSLLCLPLRRGDAVLGVAYFEHGGHERAFADAPSPALQALADHAAAALEFAAQGALLAADKRALEQRIAERTDELLLNRNTIDSLLQHSPAIIFAKDREGRGVLGWWRLCPLANKWHGLVAHKSENRGRHNASGIAWKAW